MLLPSRFRREADKALDLARYRRIWWIAVLLTLVVALAPLVVMSELTRTTYSKALTTEANYGVARALTNASRSLRFILEERTAALQFLAREEQIEKLGGNEALRETLTHLRQSFGGFVDLGIIRNDGRQVLYAGPYDLQDATYGGEDWLRQVLTHGAYVSEVFLGHRKVPHFVIAVRKDLGRETSIVLRATVDMQLLTDIVHTTDMGPSGEIFITNHEGTLQTSTTHHGDLFDSCPVAIPPRSSQGQIREGTYADGQRYLCGCRYLEGSPFVLVAVKRGLAAPGRWQLTRTEMWSILGAGTFLIGLVVLGIATVMVRQLQAADRERVEILQRIEFTSKMATLGRFSASVAHEINNPLAIINEKAGLLKDLVDQTPDHPYREKTLAAIASIHRSIGRCGRVTHRLLGFTRRPEAHLEKIPLDDLLLEVLSFTGKEAHHRNVTVEKHFDSTAPPILSDRGQLQQVFLNLVSNALAAVESGGRIELQLEKQEGGMVAVAVEDDGVGIPADKLPYVFEPFFSLKGEFGTGLGLSIVYEIIQRLGGRIEVESQEGVGTKVTVLLPVEMREKE